MEDPYREMDELLNNWNLPQLCESFREQEIEIETLEALTERDIIELIPKIGPRAIFRKRLNEWLEMKSKQEEDTQKEQHTQETFINENSIEHNFTIETVETIENSVPQAYMPVNVVNDAVEVDHEIWIDNSNEDSLDQDGFKVEVLDIENISDENEDIEVKPKKQKLSHPTKSYQNFKNNNKITKLNTIKTENDNKQQTLMNIVEESTTENDETDVKETFYEKVYHKKSAAKTSVDIELMALKQNQKGETQRFLNVEEILHNSAEGCMIMEKYASKPVIDKPTRFLICDLIISEVFAKNLVMDRTKFQDIAQQIVDLFPSEDIKSWFVPQIGNARNSGGSLFYKYYGVYRKMRKAGYCDNQSNESELTENVQLSTNSESISDEPDKLAFKRAIPKYERLRRSCDFERIDVSALLDSSYEGRGVAETYEKYQTFDANTRNRLCKLIIMEAYHRNIKMQPRDFYDISCQIVDLFPNETVDMYFLPRGRTPPKGCLYHKYLYIKRKLRKMDLESNDEQKNDNLILPNV